MGFTNFMELCKLLDQGLAYDELTHVTRFVRPTWEPLAWWSIDHRHGRIEVGLRHNLNGRSDRDWRNTHEYVVRARIEPDDTIGLVLARVREEALYIIQFQPDDERRFTPGLPR